MTGVRLDERAVAAPEVLGGAAPLLARAAFEREEVRHHAGARVLLGEQAVVQVGLDVVQRLDVSGPAEDHVRQPDHVVHRAVLLGLRPPTGGESEGRRPDLTRGLAAGAEGAALDDRRPPVGGNDLAPPLVAGDLVRASGSEHLGNRGVGVHVGEHVLSGPKRVEEGAVPVAVEQVPVPLVAGGLEEIGPDLQHPAGLDLQDLLESPGVEPARPPCDRPRRAVRDPQRALVAEVAPHVDQSHQRLVDRVLGRPGLATLTQSPQERLGGGEHPLAAVLVLAPLQPRHHVLEATAQQRVARGGDLARRGRHPVPEEVPAQERPRGLPAPVAIETAVDEVGARRMQVPGLIDDPGLEKVILQQIPLGQ